MLGFRWHSLKPNRKTPGRILENIMGQKFCLAATRTPLRYWKWEREGSRKEFFNDIYHWDPPPPLMALFLFINYTIFYFTNESYIYETYFTPNSRLSPLILGSKFTFRGILPFFFARTVTATNRDIKLKYKRHVLKPYRRCRHMSSPCSQGRSGSHKNCSQWRWPAETEPPFRDWILEM